MKFGCNKAHGTVGPTIRIRFQNFVEGQPDMIRNSGTKGATVEIGDLLIWEAGDFLREDYE
jgi:hypothetical protein